MTTFHTTEVQGLNVFYRQAGDTSSPKLLLLGGFPSSSHQFRNLIPALAPRFHILSVDYPGFGNTDMPDPAAWDYTFDHLAGWRLRSGVNGSGRRLRSDITRRV
jgi:pimeloyl-ACP methyl ester carboxylesterase